MKIKSVCEKTGLTDRTIRYYIEEGLISPSFTENYLGRKSFDFSDHDIAELCDIAVLRNFDFSIEEIKELLRAPESSVAIIKAVKERVNGKIHTNEKKLSALLLLNEHTVYTVSQLAGELSKPEKIIPAEETVERSIWRSVTSVMKGGISFLALWFPIAISASIILISFIRYEHPIVNSLFLVLNLLLLLPSILTIVSPRIKRFQRSAVKKVLFFVCLACIPLSTLASIMTVGECEHHWIEIAVEEVVSCAKDGKVVRRCDICHDVAIEVIKSPSHTVVINPGTDATCSYEGVSEGQHCSVCQTVLVKQEVIPKKAHVYIESQVNPTCDKEGYRLFVCSCGYSYRDSIIAATERHQFKKNGEHGFICTDCSLEVCEYGLVSGSGSGGEQLTQYYITGRADPVNVQERTLVIYGNGEMPQPMYQTFHPWRNSAYVEEIRTIVICEGVSSIATGAFSGSDPEDNFFGNPFHSVERFIIKGTTLTVDPSSPDVSGIECDITYER